MRIACGAAFTKLGRYDEAAPLVASGARSYATYVGPVALWVEVAVERGESARVDIFQRVLNRLAATYAGGDVLLFLSRVAVRGGEMDRAIALLRDAGSRGMPLNARLNLHADPLLRRLSDRADFRAILEPGD